MSKRHTVDTPPNVALASLGPLESRVMAIMWAKESAAVQDVVNDLARQGHSLAYTTVMTILSRLVKKTLLNRQRAGKAYVYTVAVSQERFATDAARILAQRLVRGYDHLAIASFVEEVSKVGPERLQELRDLVNRASPSDGR